MRPIPATLTWESPEFLVRLFASYLFVPLVPPVLLLVTMYGSNGMSAGGWFSSGDWFGIVLGHGIFTLAAMLILGTPLLALYLWLGWTNFISFMAGGGVCTEITAYAMGWGDAPLFLACLVAAQGIISGAVFRLILFGAQTYTPAPNQGVSK
jgi:hypothetical protein